MELGLELGLSPPKDSKYFLKTLPLIMCNSWPLYVANDLRFKTYFLKRPSINPDVHDTTTDFMFDETNKKLSISRK